MRHYRGSSAEDRRLERRSRLIDAARRVYAERGFSGATVKAICQEAGLTERYFYESFPNGEALFIAMHKATSERIIADLRNAEGRGTLSPDERVRAMVAAYYAGILKDPISARLFAVDAIHIGPAAREVCATWRQGFATLLAEAAQPGGPLPDPIVRSGVARALLGIGVDWMEDGFAVPMDRLVDAGATIAMALRKA